jgi:alkaline phosphatase D
MAMRLKAIFFVAAFFSLTTVFAQQKLLISGPMPGNVQLRDAMVWCEVSRDVNAVAVKFWKKGGDKKDLRTIEYKGALGNDFNPLKFTLGGLDINTTYQYQLFFNKQPAAAGGGELTTKDLWQWRKPAPDFSFLAGSCTYFNQPEFDRPGKPYGGDSSIFETMAKTPAAFMLWLGDNWYTREVDYMSEWGLNYRPSRDRSLKVLQNFWTAMPHYAIWDDHDYGPNDADKSYELKEASRKVFMNNWLNPSFGENGQGVYTKFQYSDVDFFLLDDRWFRSADSMKDSLNGGPNPEKRMFGFQQIDWLKNALLMSKGTFKIIVTGSQVLNPVSPFDCFRKFPAEYYELMEFLRAEKITGVVFFTGDRHHSEVIKLPRAGTYALYDVTASPLTSGTHKFGGPEKNNPYRVLGIDEKQNFSKVTVSGAKGQRKLTVEFLGIQGDKLGEWSVVEGDLK